MCYYFNPQIYGHGYGGQIVMEGTEDVNYKHMVICKMEVSEYIKDEYFI